MRENGFDYPLHPLQCLTWALFPVILLDFYWLLLPLLPGEATRWAVGTAYTAAAATTFFCAWITAAVDPRDPSVAAAVIRYAGENHLGRSIPDPEVDEVVRQSMWFPDYVPAVPRSGEGSPS